ncbi:transmembrane protein 19-like isoform X1 [Eriocheir sinensis]|uniref:transmembrane protein 19-like isoform X1 n=1 Tax=Eriocheir sinensis TaxID=95602 RepID=UPI0021C8BF51|nr:transmembrane protein 19-like isoform X1 [Eriocheir sinensis]
MRGTFLLLLFITLPVSVILWLSNAFLSSVIGGSVIEPSRWLSATLFPLVVAWWGLRKGSISFSGAICGLVVGFLLTLGSYAFFINLLVFFVSSSKATKYKSTLKRKTEANFKEGGERNWVQVICNGGVASLISWFYIVDCGCGENPVDLIYNYRCSWLSVAVLGALACCNGDTWASELGAVLSFGDPVLITNLHSVPRGTNGGISIIGLVVSCLGGLVVGVGHYLTLLMLVSSPVMIAAPPQWPIVLVGAAGGLLGSIIDSLLGATMQYSGITSDGKIVEHPGEGIVHISGTHILDNHAVNLISSLLTAVFLPRIALLIM